MNNYEFCVQWVLGQRPDESTRVLDYGCGAGQIVKELRERGVNAFGCDLFYEGGDYSAAIDPQLFGAGVIKRMEGDAIPFSDHWFDFIINNQVMEHVANMDGVLAEMRRVLKPDGAVLSLFPVREVWREGHFGIPFLHWFPKHSRSRVYYAWALRRLGFGDHKGTKSPRRWSEECCAWLDQWTHYRSRQEVLAAYRKYFSAVQHIEEDWLQQRLGANRRWLAGWPVSLQRRLVTTLAGLVLVARQPV